MSKGSGRVGTRVGAIRDWLARQTDSWVGRLSFLWFKRYMQASKNSGASTSAYFMLSVFPTALVAIAFFGQARGRRPMSAAAQTPRKRTASAEVVRPAR